jgi:hypothetical protein
VEDGGGRPSRGTYFPIADSWKEFEAAGHKKVQGASKNAVELIRQIRPYKGGNNTLWRLHRLDIADKHRLLITVGSSYQSFRTAYRLGEWESPTINLVPRTRLFPLVDKAELYRVPVKLRESAENQPEPEFIFDIALGEREVVQGEPIFQALTAYVRAVREAVELFAPLLDPEWTPF